MLIRSIFLISLCSVITSACSNKSSSEKLRFFDEEFSRSLVSFEVFIAGYQTHIEETSTDMVDLDPDAKLALICEPATCYQENLQKIDEALALAKANKCYPTFFMHKFVLQSANESIVFYLDFDGRQVKISDQCYQFDDNYKFYVDSLGLMNWNKPIR